MKQPDYIKCISSGESGRSFCGGEYEPFFINIEHALNTVMFGSRLLVCPDCAYKVAKIMTGEIICWKS